MTVRVIFSRRGFVHPAFGRMGMGDMAGAVYDLPDVFREPGMLPRDTRVIDDMDPEALEEYLEERDQKRPIKPKVTDEEQMEAAKKKAAEAKKKSAAAKKKAAAAKKAAVEEKTPGPDETEVDETEVEETKPRRSRRRAG